MMVIIEKDAIEKRCCGPEGCGRVLRNAADVYERWCIASKCMAWIKIDQIGIDPQGRIVTKDMDGRTRWIDRGICGLAKQAQS